METQVKEIAIDDDNSRRISVLSSSISIGEIAVYNRAELSSVLCSRIEYIFKENDGLQGIPLINEAFKVQGLIMRNVFFSRIGTQYGWALYMNKSVEKIMDKSPIIVDYNTTLDVVSQLTTSRPDEKQYDLVIVEKENTYYGIVTVISILKKMMEIELNAARYANPLTGLPGNVVIENKIVSAIQGDIPFSLLYFDLNDFKAYNDKYGFEFGDRVICFTANIICRHLCLFNNYFVGHVGGDDFVALIYNHDADKLCKNICKEFDNNISKFYSEEDAKRGYIISHDRNGEKEKFPLMSIAIGVVNNKNNCFASVEDLTVNAAKIKKKCKIESKEKKKSCFTVWQ